MKNLVFSFIIFCMVGCSTQAHSKNTSEERNIGDFSGIDASAGIEVYIKTGKSPVITLEGDPEHVASVRTVVKNGVLTISYEKNNIKKKKVKVYVSPGNLSSVAASSGALIQTQTTLKTTYISVVASSGASINLDLDAGNVRCNVSSGSHVSLKGKSAFVDVNSSSGSRAEMKSLIVEKGNANASSGSDISLHVTKELDAQASSGSNINYYGNPEKVNPSTGSGGKIRKK